MMSRMVRSSVEQLAEHFSDLNDPRSSINQKHPFQSVVMIALMGVLAGASGPTSIAKWAKLKCELLLRVLPLPNGVPCKDVFRRVLSALKPEAFQTCFANWIQSIRTIAAQETKIDQPVLAIDGQTMRRTHNRAQGLGPLPVVSVWVSEYGMTLGQVACAEKSNEITAIPELLRMVNIEGTIITIDAMGTQTEIAKQIVGGKGDYVLALKGNHEKLYAAVKDHVDEQMHREFQGIGARRLISKENGHGREETRHVIQMPAPKTLPGFGNWKGLLTIGVVMLTSLRNGKESQETRYYLSSLAMGVKRFANAVRKHWAIENTCHWSLDMTYREDESRIQDRQLANNISWLNRWTLTLLKQRPGKDSLVMKRRSCGWNDDYLIETLCGVKQ